MDMFLSTIVWDVDPIFIKIGDFGIGYYGLLWAISFMVCSFLFAKIVKREKLNPESEYSAFITLVIATIVGARLGHCLGYEPMEYLIKPWTIITGIREGGLASHGAAIGLLVGIWIWSNKWKMPYIWMLDRIAVMVPIAGVLVRLGNLLNSEIYGTATDLPWGFIFVRAEETTAMHPTQIYEIIAYLMIFALMAHLYWRTKISDRRGVMFGLFLILLFGARFLIENIKQPQQIWEQEMILNMGQLLSLPFIIAGVVILIIAFKHKAKPYNIQHHELNIKSNSSSSKRR